MFNHESLDIDLISEMRYNNSYFADVPPRNATKESIDSIPITNPFDIIDEFEKVKEGFKFHGPGAMKNNNNINAMSTDYCCRVTPGGRYSSNREYIAPGEAAKQSNPKV